jgi:dephospho-CoA kinase
MSEPISVKGVLDRPSSESLAMLGLVVARADGSLHTESVVGSQSGRIGLEEFQDLLERGDAQRVELPSRQRSAQYAALWVGKSFEQESEDIGLSVPPLPQQNSVSTNEGIYWIAPLVHVWRVIDFWTLRAFRQVVLERDPRIARLMTWALPNRPETRAARWLTAKGTAAKDKEIDWSIRLGRDSGGRGATRESLIDSFLDLIDRATAAQEVRVVGFTALAAGGDGDIAEFVANKQKLPTVSFGTWLREQAIKQGESKPDRRFLQKLGQDMINSNGELALFLDVLESFQLGPAQPFIIEGIRHRKVLESIQTLVGTDLFYFAFVDRPEQERIQRLQEREHLSAAEVQQVLNDPTEVEIPALKNEANIELDRDRGVEVEGTRLIREMATV